MNNRFIAKSKDRFGYFIGFNEEMIELTDDMFEATQFDNDEITTIITELEKRNYSFQSIQMIIITKI
jgi:hypothetical protein